MKKKIFIVALVVCIMAISIASASMAYFTDTETVDNTFTSGDVEIQITEAKVTVEAANSNGTENIVKVNSEERQINTDLDYSTIRSLYPGQTIAKDPTIENIGSEDAYVAAKITIAGVKDLVVDADTDGTGVVTAATALLTGGALHTAGNMIAYGADANGNVVVYLIVSQALVAENGKVMLFDTVNIPKLWGNDQMKECADLKITVDAYATQKVGFADATTAIKTAFETEFDSITFSAI